MEGRPYLKHLEDFGKAALDDLWTAVQKLFVEVSDLQPPKSHETHVRKLKKKKKSDSLRRFTSQEGDGAEGASDEQEVHQGALQRQFFSRAKQLRAAVELVEGVLAKGGTVVVEGAAGYGKTVFMVTASRTRYSQRLCYSYI